MTPPQPVCLKGVRSFWLIVILDSHWERQRAVEHMFEALIVPLSNRRCTTATMVLRQVFKGCLGFFQPLTNPNIRRFMLAILGTKVWGCGEII
jgi:hypothetical protein